MQYNSFISQIKFDKILIPGGFYGSSYIGVTISKSRSIQVITYDADENYMLFSIDGIAAHLSDFSISFNNIFAKDEDRIFAMEKGMNKILERMQNKDEMYKLFNKNVICNIELLNDGYYLMLLNSVWDATTLGMHTVYDRMVDWIIDTIRWILEHTNKTIVIRQHPAERNKLAKSNDDYEQIIQNIFGNEVRIVLVAPEDDVNTYALIKKSSTVVGFCSTSVVESVALGKPAIIVSSTYYANLGIVYNANSKEEYYSYLYKSSKNELEVTQEMKDRACVCNYITQSCNWYKTEFTPNRNNFLKWSKRSLEELEKDYLPLQAILENNPVSLLKHKENYFAH
jgi:capsule polysaccharide modification protein KpsS